MAKSWSPRDRVEHVEWRVGGEGWKPMDRLWEGLWSEWSVPVEPGQLGVGEATLVVKATTASSARAYDAVPIRVDSGHSVADAYPGPEMVFELFGLPE